MKYFILAGEASGDLHGSNLIKAIFKLDPNAQIQAWGGELMETAGAKINKHYKELAFMGFVEVLKNLRTILNNFSICKKEILHFNPDVVIMIDYPGFNLRMSKWAFEKNIRVFYYISPQIWAWKTGRVHQIKKYVEQMYVILPFEKTFYKNHQVNVEYYGHPLADVLQTFKAAPDFYKKNNLSPDKPIIALLPGSRKQEITTMLAGMETLFDAYKDDFQLVIAGAPAIEKSVYQSFLNNYPFLFLIQNQTYDLLNCSTAAIVTSGTATLETTLFNVPQVVCYKGNWFSYQLAKRLVNKELKFIAIPNIIAGQAVVTELIQSEFNPKRLREELDICLSTAGRKNLLKGYDLIFKQLKLGDVSENIASSMFNRLS